jgi:hypothetical protein
MPLSERTGNFQRWRPLPFDSPPPKTPRQVTLSWRPWAHGHGPGAKRQKHGWEVFKKKVELSIFFFFSKRYISAENDSRMLNLGSKCANKSTLEKHKTPWQYWCICTVGCTYIALNIEKLKVLILFGKGNGGWIKFPRPHLIPYCSRLGGLKRLNLVSKNREFNFLPNETKFILFCVLQVVPRSSGT